MKTLFTALTIACTFTSFAQDFALTPNTAKTFNASYLGGTSVGVFDGIGKFIHANGDILEVLDLQSGKVEYKWDPDGAYGDTWISADGKFAGMRAQNAKNPAGQYKEALHILDVTSGKVYTKFLDDEVWNKGAFLPGKSQVLVNGYDEGEGKARLLLYDYISQKEIRTYFTTTKFSTTIMANRFSEDGSVLYVGIAENSDNSYFQVYETSTGNSVKKVQLSYQMSRIFVSDEYIYVSGAEGNSGDPHTTKLDKKTYAKVAEWDFEIYNIDPSGNFSFDRTYNSNKLTKYDLKTGGKSEIADLSSMPLWGVASGFSNDGSYFFTGISREEPMKDQAGKPALIVFPNDLMNDIVDVQEEEVEEVETMETVQIVAKTYTSETFKFKIDFEGIPTVEDSETSKGQKIQTIKQSPSNDVAYVVVATELPSTIKQKKYAKAAVKMADTFVGKIGPETSNKTTFSINGQEGTEYTFNKGTVFYRYRAVCVDGMAYQLIYLYSGKEGASGENFFNSFTTKN